MQEASTRKIYDIHSMFYDATFGRLVKRRIERAINHMNIADTDRVLDLGIGTGVSLNFYPNRGRIVGVDLSAGMLRECRKKIRERGLDGHSSSIIPAAAASSSQVIVPVVGTMSWIGRRFGSRGPSSTSRRGSRFLGPATST